MPGSRTVRAFVAATSLAATAAVVATAPAASAHPHPGDLSWRLVDTGTTSHFRGLAAVSGSDAWLGGYDGTVLRTTDGGAHWANVSPAGASTLQFRDISAFDARHAVAMAAGTATDSRMYYTGDGGSTWTLTYTNR